MRTILPRRAITIPDNAEQVFKGIVYDVFQWQQQLYDGSFTTFEMLRRPDTVKVVAVIEGKVVILKQEQPGRLPFYDVPGGLHDHADETELQAAQRELREETGLVFDDWRLVSAVQPNARIEAFVYTYVASRHRQTLPQRLDAGERIKVEPVSLARAKTLLGSDAGRFAVKEIMTAETIDELLDLPEFH